MVKLFLSQRLFGNNYGSLEFLAKLETLFGGVPLDVYQLQIIFARKRCMWMKCVLFVMPRVRLLLIYFLNVQQRIIGRSCFAWFYSFFASHSAYDYSLMTMISWMLWKNRNDIVWRGKRSSARFLVNLASRMLYEWTAVQSPQIA